MITGLTSSTARPRHHLPGAAVVSFIVGRGEVNGVVVSGAAAVGFDVGASVTGTFSVVVVVVGVVVVVVVLVVEDVVVVVVVVSGRGGLGRGLAGGGGGSVSCSGAASVTSKCIRILMNYTLRFQISRLLSLFFILLHHIEDGLILMYTYPSPALPRMFLLRRHLQAALVVVTKWGWGRLWLSGQPK